MDAENEVPRSPWILGLWLRDAICNWVEGLSPLWTQYPLPGFTESKSVNVSFPFDLWWCVMKFNVML